MTQNSGKIHLPLTLEPMVVAERHVQVHVDSPAAAPLYAPSADIQKKGLYSELLQRKQSFSELKPLPNIKKYKYSLPSSKSFVVEKVKRHPALPQPTEQKVEKRQVLEPFIDYRKAMEPKVMLPFITTYDQTPRKIEIERKKRFYSSQNIQALISVELDKLKEAGLLSLDSFHSPPNVKHATDSMTNVAIEEDLEKKEPEEKQKIKDLSDMLPLEVFDDSEFDPRTVDDWLDMSAIPDDENSVRFKPVKLVKKGFPEIRYAVVPLPAKAFDGVQWQDCIVVAYDELHQKWKVKWRTYNGWELDRKEAGQPVIHPEDDGITEEFDVASDPREVIDGKELWLHRINIMFLAEDPINFAKRIAKAFYLRYQTALHLKYNFCIDNMPIDNLWVQLSEESLKKIISSAVGTSKELRQLLSATVADNVIKQLQREYYRSHNRMLFDYEMSNFRDQPLYAKVELPLPPEPVSPPECGKVVIPHYDWKEASYKFSFTSYLTKVEVIKTLCKVRTECDKLANTPIFATNITKTVKLDEFEQIQAQSLVNIKNQLKDSWITTLKNIVRNGFKDVGKGWFNMQESNMEVYKISKLKKFMNALKFVMQDSLRFLIINSLNDYVKFIKGIACQQVIIKGTNDVKVIDPSSKNNGENTKKPLFVIDILFKFGKLQYNMDITAFETTLLNIFDKAFSASENLPQLEPLVLDQIFWASKPSLQPIHPKDQSLRKLRASLVQTVRDSTALLQEYIRHFDQHLKLLNLDIASFSEDYEAKEKSLEEMEHDIAKLSKDWEELEKDIPSYTNLGMFWVSCENVRSCLRKDLSKVIMELIAKRASKLALSIIQSFAAVQARLKERPTKIEELMELREYMKTVPEITKYHNGRLQEMLKYYDALEKYRYECGNEDMRAKWTAFGWPGKIEEMMITAETTIASEEQAFFKSLQNDQEIFKDRIVALGTYINDFSKHHDLSRINEIVSEVNRISNEIKDAQAMNTLINSRERLFGLEPTKYEEISQFPREFEAYKNLWLTANDWVKWKDQWMLGSFIDLNAEEVEKQHLNASRNIFKSLKTFKNSPGCYEVAKQIKEEMEDFKPNIPLIQALRNPGMRERHWDILGDELKLKVKPDDHLTLTDLLKMKLLDKIDIISKVCDVAGKEYSIENALDKMDIEWKAIDLEILSYKETGTYIMKTSEDVTRMLDDHLVMTQSMGFSPYKKPFADRISLWESKLKTVQEVLESWSACQRSWLYLEPIFGSDDIVTQLPVESKRFTTMDRTWRKIMNQANSKPGVIDFCADAKLLDSFRECNKLLELVAKGLSAYLESKRVSFPRFFFLSDDELLQILSQTKDPTAVQPHLRKCFENVASIEFQADNLITAMFSGEGEKIRVSDPFYPKGPVEEWLLKVENAMRHSVRNVIREAILDYPSKERTDWVLKWPGQAVLSGSQTYWTAEVSEALRNGTLKALYTKLLAQLQGLVGLVRGELPFLSRLVLGDLIVIDVHSRDVVKKMIDNNIATENDFEWISQLRYYWEEDDLRIKIVNANFK